MKIPSIQTDFWEIQMPSLNDSDAKLVADRKKLKRGDAVKLTFLLEPNAQHKAMIPLFMEFMWVVITEELPEDLFIGVLFSSPGYVTHYLTDYVQKGAEVPFHRDHTVVVQFAPSPEEAEAFIASHPVASVWPRN